MQNILSGTKSIINKQVTAGKIHVFGQAFSECQKVYKETNENIAGYMQFIDFTNINKALSVLASGDQIFNLIFNGILNIETFDTNCLAKYYVLGLKRALILSHSYEQYLLLNQKMLDSNITLEELYNIIHKTFAYMDEEYRKFWQEIMDYNYHIQKHTEKPLNLLEMLLINMTSNFCLTHNNAYLSSFQNYEIMRHNLNKANISFECFDAINLGNKTTKYDIIILSNILDYFYKYLGYYWDYSKLQIYIESLRNISNENAYLILAYLIKTYSNNAGFKTHPIQASKITISDLQSKEIKIFSHIEENKVSKEVKDGIILQRIL